jgi:F-type H+-transporting ATPase subunit b
MFLIPHLGTFIWVSIIFAIVYFVLAKFAWKPLMKTIEDREHTIDDGIKNANLAMEKLKNIELIQERMIALAKEEKEQIVKEGMEKRDQIIANATEKAMKQATKIIDDTHRQMEREREFTTNEIRKQIASLSVEIATKLVKSDLEEQHRHEKLVENLIKEIELN